MKIIGTDKDDTIEGTAFDDIIRGLGGNDIISARGGADRVDGGDGNDAIGVFSTTGSRIYGGTGDDIISLAAQAGSTNIRIDGGIGTDRIQLHGDFIDLASRFVVDAAGARYELVSVEDIDVYSISSPEVYGDDAANHIYVSAQSDGTITVDGRGGDDAIIPVTFGAELLSGGNGDDYMMPGFSDGTISHLDGGAGSDTIDLFWLSANSNVGVSVRLRGDYEVELSFDGQIVARISSVENFFGGESADTITGDAADNRFDGFTGDDRLTGGNGDDTLIGSYGTDRLIGSAGADTFEFSSIRHVNNTKTTADVVQDFSHAEGDKIAITFDANSLVAGTQDFKFVGAQSFSGVAGELRSYASGTSTMIAGDIDGNGSADFLIRLVGQVELTTADFTF